jgi:DNA-binding response OmpR family regulator
LETSTSKHLLYIEDDPEMIDLVALILARNNFQLTGALNGEDGLKKATDTQPDLILLDIMMPGMDGWNVLRQLKASPLTKSIPVVILSAKTNSIDRFVALQFGRADAYITKPFHADTILEVVEGILNNTGSPDKRMA